jgi:cardiolipin synthase
MCPAGFGASSCLRIGNFRTSDSVRLSLSKYREIATRNSTEKENPTASRERYVLLGPYHIFPSYILGWLFLNCGGSRYCYSIADLVDRARITETTPPLATPPAASKILGAIRSNPPFSSSHENIYTIPNFLTLTRLAAAPVIGYLVLHDSYAWALGLFVYAGVTDFIDGWVARRWQLQTVVGTVLDPMADKLLMTVLVLSLAAKGSLPPWLAALVLGRDIALALAAFYYRFISLPPPKTFARYWDFSLPSAEVRPTVISKYNTALQLVLMGATTAMPVIAPLVTLDLATSLTTLQYLVAITTVWSGASYLYTKDAVRLLNQPKKGNKVNNGGGKVG